MRPCGFLKYKQFVSLLKYLLVSFQTFDSQKAARLAFRFINKRVICYEPKSPWPEISASIPYIV